MLDEFIEPEIKPEISNEKPKVFTTEFISDVVKKSIADGSIPPDHKFVLLAATDEQGIQGMVGVKIHPTEKSNLSINFIGEHTWSGDNKIGAKVIFSF
jgi:hypothetical protein